jgi:5-formyltetrahydrofolate cyclo-ligase
MRKAAAETIAACGFPLRISPGVTVSGFMPLKSEINPLPLMQKLRSRARGLRCRRSPAAASR